MNIGIVKSLFVVLVVVFLTYIMSFSVSAVCSGCTPDCPCNAVTESCDCESHTVPSGGAGCSCDNGNPVVRVLSL